VNGESDSRHAMDTGGLLIQVERQHIGLLCSFLAGYEGVAIVRTRDPQQGLVELLIAPAFYTTALDILQALSQEMPLSLLPGDSSVGPQVEGARESPGPGSHLDR